MLKRIKIEGYKSFKQFELRLRPLMVIMGPNATGKSNFLDALYLLSKKLPSLLIAPINSGICGG